MQPVFPWSSTSALVGLGLVAALLIATLVLALIGQRARRLFASLEHDVPHALFYRRARFLRRAHQAVAWSLGLGATYLAAYASTWVWEPLFALTFVPMVSHIAAVLIIFGTYFAATMGVEIVRDIPDRAATVARWRGKKPNRQLVHAAELFLRYAIVATATLIIGASVLDIVGFQGNIAGAFLSWITTQAGALFLLASLLAIGWIGGRLVRAVATEVRSTSSRMSPKVVDALGATTRGVLYTVLGLVGIITLLQSIGLGSVGGTLVIVMSSFIGIAVAMAGTGSLGNALSGVVLLAFRPIDKGDRVIIADDLVCDVEEVTPMFTRVRTLARELVEVPNNQVLLRRISNLTRSGSHAIVVKLGIGYDVSHTLVRELSVAAAQKTEGIIQDPAPALFARKFGNYAIDYELYAYTIEPRHLKIRSDLLGHLQEGFHAAGVEIMTPDVMVMRKGKVAEEEGIVRLQIEAPRKEADAQPSVESG